MNWAIGSTCFVLGFLAMPCMAQTQTEKPQPGQAIVAAAGANQSVATNIASLVIPRRRQFVLRSPQELAAHGDSTLIGRKTASPAEHADALAQQLQVKNIDWKTHMIIAISAGQQGHICDLEITKVLIADKALHVHWKIHDSGDTALSHPRLVVLVKRFDGPVYFMPEPPGLPLRTLAKGAFAADFEQPEQLVVRDEKVWKKLWARLAGKADGLGTMPVIDFNKDMVVAAFRGKATQIQAGIEILQAEQRGPQVSVFYCEPDRGGRDEPPANRPFHIVVMPQHDGKVIFQKVGP